MQIAPSCLKSYIRLDQNEVKEPKPSTHFQEHSKSLIKKGSWITNFDLCSKCTFRNILINFQTLKTKQKLLQLTAWIQFPGNSAGEGNKQNPSLPELQRQSLESRGPVLRVCLTEGWTEESCTETEFPKNWRQVPTETEFLTPYWPAHAYENLT